MAIQKSGIPLTSNEERLRHFLIRFIPIIAEMDSLFRITKKYQFMLSEPRLLFRYRKNWIALWIAYRMFNVYKSQTPINIESIQADIKSIEGYDKQLAEEIRKLLPTVKNETNIFADLFGAYSRGRAYLFSYILTHAKELITRARSIENKSISRRLVELFASISGHEVEFLMKYREDCTNWSNVRYAVNYGIEFFIRRLNLYLKGGFEGNMQFMGLYRDFGDTELTKRMLESNAIKSLWRFHEQLNYLNVLIGLCRKSEESGEWEGFYGENGFWGKKGDAKGKNFDRNANEFGIKYGNVEFAETLKAQKWKVGENPEGWGGEWKGNSLVKDGVLPLLLRRLQNPQYQRSKIIIPTSLELSELLKKREEELMRTRDRAVDDLIEYLHKLSGIELDREKVLSKFSRLLAKQRSKLTKQLKSEKNELISKIAAPFLDIDEFSKEQKSAMAKVELEYRESRIRVLQSLAEANTKYVRSQLISGKFLNDLTAAVFIDGADSSARLASLQINRLIRFNHLNEEDFQQLGRLIPRAMDLVKKLRVIVYSYIKGNLDKKYTIKIEVVDKLQIDVDKVAQGNLSGKTGPDKVGRSGVIPKAA